MAVLATLLFTTACSNTKEHPAASKPLTPLPAEFTTVQDPQDTVLIKAIEDYLKTARAPAYTRYEFTRIDLDNDTRRDALVMMKTPYRHWCGAYGCAMAIFKAHNDNFTLTSEITPVRGPIVVSEDTTNGWRDLIVRASGRTYWEAKTVAMKFDGRSYPPEPLADTEMTVACTTPQHGTTIFP